MNTNAILGGTNTEVVLWNEEFKNKYKRSIQTLFFGHTI